MNIGDDNNTDDEDERKRPPKKKSLLGRNSEENLPGRSRGTDD